MAAAATSREPCEARLAEISAQMPLTSIVDEPRERLRLEERLDRAGWPLALRQRVAWHTGHGLTSFTVCAAAGEDLEPGFGFSVEVRPIRALPGHVIWNVPKLRSPAESPLFAEAIRALAEAARRSPRVLRVDLQCIAFGEGRLDQMRRVLEESEFEPRETSQSYRDTIVFDLMPSEAEIFASFSRKIRRDCRFIERSHLSIRPIESDRFDDRLAELLYETWERSNDQAPQADWAALRRLCAAQPPHARLLGLFDDDRDEPESLLAFALAELNGDHASYTVAGSTRHVDPKIPMAPALLWELARWAKGRDARFFDLGGFVPAEDGDPHRLGAISRFKQYFAKEPLRVGQEWTYSVRPYREAAARSVSRAVRFARRLRNNPEA